MDALYQARNRIYLKQNVVISMLLLVISYFKYLEKQRNLAEMFRRISNNKVTFVCNRWCNIICFKLFGSSIVLTVVSHPQSSRSIYACVKLIFINLTTHSLCKYMAGQPRCFVSPCPMKSHLAEEQTLDAMRCLPSQLLWQRRKAHAEPQ